MKCEWALRRGDSPELFRVLGTPDASNVPHADVADNSHALMMYRQMVALRVLDERALVYHRHGRIGTWAISWGHEAIHVGVMAALRDTDWAFPSYRENKLCLLRGMSPEAILAGCRGQPEGFWNPHEWRVGSICIPVASHVPHAAGFAWGEKLQGRDTVAAVFFGDGATSEGEFHEGANFAAVTRAPVLLVCTNNQWAISTPVSRQTRAMYLADKAVGYGIPSVRVDGNDVLAVYEATRQGAERARDGGGPVFIECVIYRAQAHAFPDDPSAYRDDVEAEKARREECLGQMETYLRARGLLSDEQAAQYRSEALASVAAGIVKAEALPTADPELIFQHVLEEQTPAMRSDMERLRAVRTRYGSP
ncbi:thiamine pyrophosphate-dependent enzyme [Sorangium sp. So ce448]|uniref:thiamine pyrophosphate-dependent enzyme n=1 Tax=Sorangium sp. So ce448 TaxID=3133314 RepID=UPI003F62D9CD